MGDIEIKDVTMNHRETFVPIREGYAAAKAYIEEIVQQGHIPGGELGRVSEYFGGSSFGGYGSSSSGSSWPF